MTRGITEMQNAKCKMQTRRERRDEELVAATIAGFEF
jgi:hypothetical protein